MSRKYKKRSKSRGTRRSSILKRRSASAERIIFWAKRFGVVTAFIVFIGWLSAWFFMSGASQKFANWTQNRIYVASANAGYSVENILVEGRNFTDAETLKAIMGIEKGDPLFAYDLAEIQMKIEQLSWVKTARVERRLPDTIYIELQERVPMALWQRNKRLSLVDTDGEVVTDHKLERFKDLLIVVGDKAPEKATSFLQILDAEPEVLNRVEAMVYVSNRRWNLKLKNGVTVKLPEDEMSLALRRLSVTQTHENIMDKDIEVIDVREPTRIIVQTKPGAVQEYQDNYSQVSATSGGQI